MSRQKVIEGIEYEQAKEKAIDDNKPPTDDWEIYADKLHDIAYKNGYEQAKKDIEQDELSSDGTLLVNTDKYDDVKRILLQQGAKGSLFYADGDIPADVEQAYIRGYNNAKQEIALSGEYERAFHRGYDKAKKRT